MTPIIIYIATYGHETRCGWCVVVVEPEGMFEEHQGVASNTYRAMLWAFYTAFKGISSGEQVGIRTLIRSILNFEKQLDIYRTDRWEEEENKDILDLFVNKMLSCEIKFIDASSYPQAGDSRAKSLAKQAHESYDMSFPEEEIAFLSSSIEIINPFLSVNKTNIDLPATEDIIPEIHIETPSPPKNIEEQEIETSEIIQKTTSAHRDIVTIENPNTQNIPNKEVVLENQTCLDSNEKQPETILPEISTSPETSTLMEIPPGSEYLFGARILAYVDGIGNGTLGAWAFVLIDRQTGWALLRAKGVTSTNANRMRLQACIEALTCLKQSSQTVEIRSRYRNLIQMGSSWMDTWKENDWKNSKKEDVADLSFLVELDELRNQHKLSWQYIPYESDEQGIREVTRLSKNALHNLNYGEYTDIESRIKNYPLHQII